MRSRNRVLGPYGRLNAILLKKSKLTEQLGRTGERLAVGAALIENALVLLQDPRKLYERMDPEQRRMMNQAIFERLYVFEDTVTDAVLNAPFDELVQAKDALSVHAVTEEAAGNPSGSLVAALSDDGSSKRVMVDLLGRLSNPADALENLTGPGTTVLHGSGRKTPKHAKHSPTASRSRSYEEKGQLSNPPLMLSHDRGDGIQDTEGSEESTPRRRSVQRRLSSSDVDALVAAYRSGRSLPDIAVEFGIHRRTVAKHLEGRSVSRRRNARKMDHAEVEEAIRQYKTGASLAAVAGVFQVDRETVRRELSRAGVTIRPRRGLAGTPGPWRRSVRPQHP